MEKVELETERLLLRKPQLSDQDFFMALYSSADVMKHIPPNREPSSKEESISRFHTILTHWNTYGYGMFVIELKPGLSPVGYCGLRFLKEIQAIELGYIIDKPYWGIGMASEAAAAAVQFAKESLKTDQIISVTDSGNAGSQKVLIKIGFTRCDGMDGPYHGMHHQCFVLTF